ncbi:MAG TPA: dihydrodipicolinate synthase family protein [Candidatus Limnocylindrales bacterium]
MGDIEALRGVWNIVPTPFLPDGELDVASIPRLVSFVRATGVDGLTILGVLGEAARLGDEERTTVLRTALEAAAGSIPICVGVSHASTDRAIVYAREAEAAGAHSVMLAPPPLARPTDAALRRHYLAVASAISIPVVVQDHPASSGVPMSVDFLLALAVEAPSCRVIKLEEEPTPPKAGRLVDGSPDVIVLGGLGGEMLIEELRRGSHGTMTGFGFPEILVAVVRRWFAGDRDGAAALFDRYATVVRFENQAILNLAIRKVVYQRRGAIAHATLRAPGMPPDAGTLADLDDLLRRTGLHQHLEAGAFTGVD